MRMIDSIMALTFGQDITLTVKLRYLIYLAIAITKIRSRLVTGNYYQYDRQTPPPSCYQLDSISVEKEDRSSILGKFYLL